MLTNILELFNSESSGLNLFGSTRRRGFTKENINKRLAIVLDGRLFSAPVIRSEISAGKAQVTGSFTEEEARVLAARINGAASGN